MSDELWADIPSAPNYQASSSGQIRSLCFNSRFVKGRWKPRVLRQAVLPSGYRQVSVSIHNKAKSRLVHRLVCEAFYGPCPAQMECAHNDGNPANNSSDNLRWTTPSENQADRRRHGTAMLGDKNPVAKLSNRDVINIRLRRSRGEPTKAIAADYGIDPSYVSQLFLRKARKEAA